MSARGCGGLAQSVRCSPWCAAGAALASSACREVCEPTRFAANVHARLPDPAVPWLCCRGSRTPLPGTLNDAADVHSLLAYNFGFSEGARVGGRVGCVDAWQRRLVCRQPACLAGSCQPGRKRCSAAVSAQRPSEGVQCSRLTCPLAPTHPPTHPVRRRHPGADRRQRRPLPPAHPAQHSEGLRGARPAAQRAHMCAPAGLTLRPPPAWLLLPTDPAAHACTHLV